MACLCGSWFRYRPLDEDEDEDDVYVEDDIINYEDAEEYQKVIAPALKKAVSKPRGSVALAIANIEKNKKALPSKQSIEREAPEPSPTNPKPAESSSYSEMALSKASAILGRLYSGSSPSAEEQPETKTIVKPRSFKVSPTTQDNSRRCRICSQKFFPTDKITTAQKHDYHVGCFKCTLCGTKLKNHPDEDHMLANNSNNNDEKMLCIILQCQRCKLDNEQKYKPRTLSTVPGERVVIGEKEQGDIEQVVDLIGDELEDAVCGMIPRCATCGGDFLSYKGEMTMIGALKYHKECWVMGKPAGGFQAAITMQPPQAARYLPDTMVVRLSSTNSNNNNIKKALSTLFFVWTNKEEQLKSLRASARQNENVSVAFHLDEDAPANPSYRNSSNSKRYVMLPLDQDGVQPAVQVDIMNDQIAPKGPRMLQPSSISYSEELGVSVLCLKVTYEMFTLNHVVHLNVPCVPTTSKLDLAGATLTTQIQVRGS